MAVLLHPKPKFRFNLSKTAVVLIAMSLTAVTMTSNVAAAAENTAPVAAQLGSNAAPGQPNGASTPEQTPPVDCTTASGFSKDKDWEKIASMDDLKPGDIMFFSTGGKKSISRQ